MPLLLHRSSFRWLLLFSFIFLLLLTIMMTTMTNGPRVRNDPATDWVKLLRSGGMNVVLTKVHKVGGSTVAGVLRRIGARYGLTPVAGGPGVERGQRTAVQEPALFAFHGSASKMWGDVNELELPVFRMALLREPGDRALSQFYFERRKQLQQQAAHDDGAGVGEDDDDGDAEAKLAYLRGVSNHQFMYLRPGLFFSPEETFEEYDLLGTRERLDETLLVLMHMLGLELSDVLYVSAKLSSAADLVKGVPLLVRPRLAQEPSAVLEHLLGSAWRQRNLHDLNLWEMADRALDDYIIEKIGERKFFRMLDAFRDEIAELNKACRISKSSDASVADCGFESADCSCFRNFVFSKERFMGSSNTMQASMD
ncbi:MAG: hypothetical protein Q8P67_01850 [archaeon]|nr:hypothetical protein [archaeon]